MTPGSWGALHWDSNTNDRVSGAKDFQKFLADISQERSFDTLLVVHRLKHDDPLLAAIYEFPVLQVFVTSGHSFEFIRKFNAEILAVIIMSHDLDLELLETAAQTLNYMRQVRILVIAWEVLGDSLRFTENLLKTCQKYKMTNVLLQLFPHKGPSELEKLKPYPEYHWAVGKVGPYYPQHWWNMQNATLITFTDQHTLRSFPNTDAGGNLRRNGFVARLILLFGERFNAHLKMYPFPAGTSVNYAAVNQMVEDNLVDIPMTMCSGDDGKWLYRSYVYEVYQSVIMVPCDQTLTIRQVYSILLNEYFFGCISICTLILSIVHSLVDYLFDGLLRCADFVFSDRVLPGVLGQSFVARNSPWLGHKLVYLLVFFAGLNISTQFAANINTLVTSPPYQHQIETFDDLKHSPLKILLLTVTYEEEYSLWAPIAKSLALTDNTTFFEESRNSFNTSTGYDAARSSWEILKRKQHYFAHKTFCIPDQMFLIRNWPRAIQLQQHSEFKEPLDYLIHRVLELGLKDAWYSSVFSDMLKAKKISIRDPNPVKEARSLTANDLFWPWMILMIGLTLSFVVLLVELWLKTRGR